MCARFKNIDLHPIVIPEFPLRIGTIFSDENIADSYPVHKRLPGRDQSCNVDYVAFSLDCSTALLVKLKADMTSGRVDQDLYLRRARNTPIGHLIAGTKKLDKASAKKPKYVNLLHLLAQLDLVQIPDDGLLYRKTFPKPQPGWTQAIENVTLTVDGKLTHNKAGIHTV